MNFPSALRVAASMIFVAGASVAGAQLSSRSAQGGLFNYLVDWNPAAETPLVGVGDVRMSPWSPNRVQLGTVQAADPNRPWMGYWGHTQDKELTNIIGAEHSLRASPVALFNAATRREQVAFVPDVPVGGGAAGDVVNENGQGENGQGENGNGSIFLPVPVGGIAPLAVNVGDASVIINPEPSVYLLSAAGLVLIAMIRRYRLA